MSLWLCQQCLTVQNCGHTEEKVGSTTSKALWAVNLQQDVDLSEQFVF